MKFKSSKSKKIIIIAIIIIIALALLFFLNRGKLLQGSSSAAETNITSNAEATARLTDVAGDITSFREELDSLTRDIGA